MYNQKLEQKAFILHTAGFLSGGGGEEGDNFSPENDKCYGVCMCNAHETLPSNQQILVSG